MYLKRECFVQRGALKFQWVKTAVTNSNEVTFSTLGSWFQGEWNFSIIYIANFFPRRSDPPIVNFIINITVIILIIIFHVFIAINSIVCWCYWNRIYFPMCISRVHTQKRDSGIWQTGPNLNITTRKNGAGGKKYT